MMSFIDEKVDTVVGGVSDYQQWVAEDRDISTVAYAREKANALAAQNLEEIVEALTQAADESEFPMENWVRQDLLTIAHQGFEA